MQNGAIIADSVYCDGKRVAENVSITLPEVAYKTITIQAMGDMDLPLPVTDALEATITKIGIDTGLRSLLAYGTHVLECRFVQQVATDDGEIKMQGCKAFLRCTPNKIPSVEIEIGSATETEITLSVMRYHLYADGKEMFLVDKLNNILRINGKNYAKDYTSLL